MNGRICNTAHLLQAGQSMCHTDMADAPDRLQGAALHQAAQAGTPAWWTSCLAPSQTTTATATLWVSSAAAIQPEIIVVLLSQTKV